MVSIGINEQNVGLVKLIGNTKLIFPPSYAAEAAFALRSKGERKSILKEFLNAYNSAEVGREEFPTLSEWAREGAGIIEWDDLESRVRKHSEGMAHLLNSHPVKDHLRSWANVDYSIIRRRGDARKGQERSRATEIVLDENEEVIDYDCTCKQFTTGFAKGRYEDKDVFVTRVACYHVSVALQENGLGPFKFEDNFSLLENLAMKVFREQSKKAFRRDRFLLKGKILNEKSQSGLGKGELTVEVIWNSRNIAGRARSIINGMKSYFETDRYGYRFAGFALDFYGTTYETTGIVLNKADGRSLHLLYDTSLRVRKPKLPFLMLKIPKALWLKEGHKAEVEQLAGRNPVLYSGGKRYFEDFDFRTHSEMVAAITYPNPKLLNAEERRQYRRIFPSLTA